MLKGVLADANIVGHVDLVMAVVRAAGWIDLWDELAISYASFQDVGLDAAATDAAIWELCQREQYVLVTSNRNEDDPDSLESTIRSESTAQSRGFYTEEQERDLKNLIEIPGNLAVEKLLMGEPIDGRERLALAAYIATMLSRVPRNRERGEKIMPVALKTVVDEVRTDILSAAERQDVAQSTVDRFLSELDAAEKKFAAEPPANVVEQMQSPWPVPAVVVSVAEMAWRLIQATDGAFFVTSDNPACFHECYGLGKPESEFTFPLASQMALFGCWQRHVGAPKIWLDKRVLREVNRRTIKEATRFIFSPQRAEWIHRVATKRDPFISLIRWKKPR